MSTRHPQSIALGMLLLLACAQRGLGGQGPVFPPREGETVEQHTVVLHHPSFGPKEKRPVTLSRRVDGRGFPVEYGTWVDSVYCVDERCEVVSVRMYWDALGRFLRYELPAGTDLTKSDHVPFTKADYAKLEAILHDQGSILRTHSVESLTRPVKTAREDAKLGLVDAVTQATEVTVKNAVVQGATYTTYNLWHWANGEPANAIQDLTHQKCNKALLLHFVRSDRQHEVLFGIEHLKQHRIFDRDAVAAVTAAMRDGESGRMKSGVAYLRAALPHRAALHDHLGRLFCGGGRRAQLYLLVLWGEETDLPANLYGRLARHIPHLREYYEFHLLLQLLERRHYSSEQLLANAAIMLDHRNFFMARRAYEFLQQRDLPPALQQKLKAFEKRNADRL